MQLADDDTLASFKFQPAEPAVENGTAISNDKATGCRYSILRTIVYKYINTTNALQWCMYIFV